MSRVLLITNTGTLNHGRCGWRLVPGRWRRLGSRFVVCCRCSGSEARRPSGERESAVRRSALRALPPSTARIRPLSAADFRQGVGEEQGERLPGRETVPHADTPLRATQPLSSRRRIRERPGTDPRFRVAGVAPALAAPGGPRGQTEVLGRQLLYLFTSHAMPLRGPLSLRVGLGNSRLQWQRL
jgi:hypothetical protein